jgi:hypothetical protein
MLTVMPSLDALNAPQMTAMQTVHPDGSSNIVEQTAEKGGTVVSSVELHSANSARGADTVVTFDAKTGKPNQVLTAGADVSLDPSTGKTRQVVEIPPVGSGQPVATVSFDSQTGKPSEVKLLNPNGADSTFKIDPTTGKATAEPSNDPQSRNDLLSWIKGW